MLFSLNTGLKFDNNRVKCMGWNLNKFDKELFVAVINVHLACIDDNTMRDCRKRARWLTSTLTMACDCAAKRKGNNKYQSRCKFWWS